MKQKSIKAWAVIDEESIIETGHLWIGLKRSQEFYYLKTLDGKRIRGRKLVPVLITFLPTEKHKSVK